MTEHKSRSQHQFEKLTLCHVEQLFRLAYARVGNTQDAEDIVQETYLKAYKAFARFRFESSIKHWLSQILVNTVRDYFRKGARTVPTTNIDDMLCDDSAQPLDCSPEQLMCDDEIDPTLTKALMSLPENLLIPLLLREIHDASYQEIAEILDVPKGTVMSRLFRARAQLRKLLDDGNAACVLAVLSPYVPVSSDNSRGSSHEV